MSLEISDSLLKAFGFTEQGEEFYKRIWATDIRYLSDHVGVRKVVDNGRIKVEIMIDSQTKKGDIPKVWSQVESQRDKITLIQGHDLSDYFQVVLDELVGAHYGKMVENGDVQKDIPIRQRIVYSKLLFRDLFMDANFDLLLFIVRVSKKDQDEERAKLAYHYFQNLLNIYNYREDIEKLSTSAIEEISEGRCPWDIYNSPIDFGKFTNKIEYLVEQHGGGRSSTLRRKVIYWESISCLLFGVIGLMRNLC